VTSWSKAVSATISKQDFERAVLSRNKAAMLTKVHWTREGENPPVGLILCSQKGTAQAHYALEGLSSKVLATEYQTVLPAASVIEREIIAATKALALRKSKLNTTKPL
jgi:YhcG PDDEXK nuclease domain